MKKFACLSVALIILVACESRSGSSKTSTTYSNEQCNFSFQYPASIGDDDIIYNDTSSEEDIVKAMRASDDPLKDPILCRIVLLATKSNKGVEILAIKPAIADEAGIRNYSVSEDNMYESLGVLYSDTEVSASKSYTNVGGQRAVKYVSYERYVKPYSNEYTGITWYNVGYLFEKDDFVYKIKSHRPDPIDPEMEDLIEQVVESFRFPNEGSEMQP